MTRDSRFDRAVYAVPSRPVDATVTEAGVDAVVRPFATSPGGLMPALHALQHEFGYIDHDAIPVLADVFNITVTEVHGVVTFYKDFRTTKPAGPIVQVCRAEACQARGADGLLATAARLAAGAAVEVDEVFCLGNSALGPSVAVDGHLYGHVDEVAIGTIIRQATQVAPATATASSGSDDDVVVFVPRDAAARSVGADDVAAALATQPGARVVRNGSPRHALARSR